MIIFTERNGEKMKNFFKKSLSVLLVIGILATLLTFSVSAAGTTIAFSNKNLKVDDTLTVTVSVNAGEAMYGVSLVVNYDSSVLKYQSGAGSGGAGTLQIVESPSGETKVSYTLTFTAIATGNCTITVSNCSYSTLGDDGAVDRSLTGAGATVNVTDITLSSNANLKYLIPTAGTLSPAFSNSVTSYTIDVPYSTTVCKVNAETEDSAASFIVEGSANLKVGKNTRTIIVTAANGTTKSYTLTINRAAEEVTSSETTSSDDGNNGNEDDNPDSLLATSIDALPKIAGFTAKLVDYKDISVAVLSDENYTVYFMKEADSDSLSPYSYDEATGLFEKMTFIHQNDYYYLLTDIPEDSYMPSQYYTSSTTINSESVKCYNSSDSVDSSFCYLYCYVDGKYGFYRYDTKENVLQRYPELTLLTQEDVEIDNEGGGFIERFNSLTSNSKVVVVCLLLIIVFAVILLVMLLFKFFKGPNYEYDDEDFDEYDTFEDFDVIEENEVDNVVIEETSSEFNEIVLEDSTNETDKEAE